MKTSNTFQWAAILIALALGIIATARTNPRTLGFDSLGVIVGILAILVAVLLGFQFMQYVFVEKKMKNLATSISESAANAAAKNIASDISHIFNGKLYMQKALGLHVPGDEMQRLDDMFHAMSEYAKCHYSVSAQSSIDACLRSVLHILKEMQSNGGLRVLHGKKSQYIEALAAVQSPYQQEASALVYMAEERPEDYDTQILDSGRKGELDWRHEMPA